MAVSNIQNKRPELRVYAGPNGSGKSTIAFPDDIIGPYINADDIQKNRGISNIEAAQIATAMRNDAVAAFTSFTFETVLSTDRNVLLLECAHNAGYFIRCSFVLTADPNLNVLRVHSRVQNGGHDVPDEKVISRYHKALGMIPRLLLVCDRLNIYDNTLSSPFRIFKKRDSTYSIFENEVWHKAEILSLISTGHK